MSGGLVDPPPVGHILEAMTLQARADMAEYATTGETPEDATVMRAQAAVLLGADAAVETSSG